LAHDRSFAEFAGSVNPPPKNRNGSGLRATVEADAAGGAGFAGVVRRMHTIGAQFRSKKEALWRAGVDAETTALTLIGFDFHLAASIGHIHLDARTGSR
jgi:hypothetical protein